MNAEAASQSQSWLQRLLYPAVLLLIFIAPSQISYAIHPRSGPFITPADALLALLLVVWLLALLVSRRWRQLLGVPFAIWALLVVAILSATKAVDVGLAAREILQFALYFVGGFLLFVDALRRRQRLRRAMDMLAVATSVIVVWGLIDYVTAPNALEVSASFGNRNVYSGYLAMVLPLLYGLGLHSVSKWHKLWLLATVVVGTVTVLCGPLFWLLLGILLIISLYHGRRTAGYCAVCVALFVVIMPKTFPRSYDAAVVELTNPYETGQIYKLPVTDASADQEVPIVKKRWLEWQPALMMIARNPMLGVGIGNYQLRIGEPLHYQDLPNVKKIEPDTNNLYLIVAGSTGLAGLVCLMALFGHFVRLAENVQIWAEDEFGSGLAAGLAGSMGAIVVGNFFTSLNVRGTAIIMVLILALIDICARRRWIDDSA